MDGVRRGTTPLELRDLALGVRRIQLRREGFAPAETRVTLTRRRPVGTVDQRLVREAPARRPSTRDEPPATDRAARGTLVMESRPAGARVTIDGRPSGVTPVVIAGLAAGEHQVRFELRGYSALSATAVVTGGQRTRLAVSLQQEGTGVR